MDMTRLMRLLPSMEMIAEEFTLAGWQYTASIPAIDFPYRSVRLFTGQSVLQPDILYALRPEETGFPVDEYSYISVTPIDGKANHICCQEQSPESVLDFLLEIFYRYQHQEFLIDQLAYGNGTLQDLCELGAKLLGNPVCIHDDWFIVLGMSPDAAEVMSPEFVMTSTKGFIPKKVLDDFKYDSDYQETFLYPNAQLWLSDGNTPNAIYVNLWDNTLYRGRLLVMRHHRDFRKSDYLLAEILTQRAIFLLQRKQMSESPAFRSMDDIILNLLMGRLTDPTDLSHLLHMLNWERTDHLLCVRLKNQQEGLNTVMDHVVHSNLFQIFPESYILFAGPEQNLILNLTKTHSTPAEIRHLLSSVCLDYCLYAGVSSPVNTIQDLHLAYFQAGIALDQVFRLRSDKWILPFSDCAVDYMLNNLNSPLAPEYLVSPDLYTLLDYDKENGTAYFDTFRTYLLSERDIPKTSEQLFIHRTTLLYRLKKIESLISVKTDDPWQRLNLLLSLWILENRKEPRT